MAPKKKEVSPGQKLKTQIGVVKRMQKEVASYEKEVVTNEGRVKAMRDGGWDEHDIRKQEEVLQESYMMVPDSKSRLEKSLGELCDLAEEVKNDESVTEEMLQEASTLLGMAITRSVGSTADSGASAAAAAAPSVEQEEEL